MTVEGCGIDARSLGPTRVCPACGEDTFVVNVVFDEAFEICFYHLDAKCLFCGCLVTAPTPIDLSEEMLDD